MLDEVSEIFACSQCNRRFAWKPALAGKRVKCKCGATIAVPVQMPGDDETLELAQDPVPVPGPVTVQMPMPVIELPTQPPPYPQQGIGYATPQSNFRPGKPPVLFVIGILSIVVGFLSILASGFTASLWWKYYAGSVPPPPLAPPVPLAAVSFSPYAGSLAGPHGLPADARAGIVAATPIDGPFAADRRAMLDRLLAEQGLDILPNQNAGDLAPAGPGEFDAYPGLKGKTIFHITGGRILLDNNSAELGWTRGVVNLHGDVVSRPGTVYPQDHWSVVAIDRRIKLLRAALPGITNMQAGFVADNLQKAPSFPRVGGLQEQIPISQASLGSGNILSITLGNASYWVMPDGRSIDKSTEPLGLDPATGRPLTVHTRPFTPMLSGDLGCMFDLFVESLATVALAVLLIVSGIVILVRPAIGVPAHCWYILIKFALTLTEVVLSLLFFQSVTAGRTPGTGARIAFNVQAGTAGLFAGVVFECIYPLTLLIMLLVSSNALEYVKESGGFTGLVSRNGWRTFRRRWRNTTGNPPVRIAFGLMALVAIALALFHFVGITHRQAAAAPLDQVLSLMWLGITALAFLWIALRKPAGGAM